MKRLWVLGIGIWLATAVHAAERYTASVRLHDEMMIRTSKGDVYLFDTEKDQLGNWLTGNVKQIFLWGDELLALKTDGTLALYCGHPRPDKKYSSVMFVGKVPITQVHRRKVSAFDPAGVGGVRAVELDGRRVWLVTEKGRSDFANAGVSNRYRGVSYSFDFDLRRQKLECRFANGKRFQVTDVWVKKDAGQLFTSVQYAVDAWADGTSGRLQVASGRISKDYPELLQGRGLDTRVFTRLFDDLIIPHSKGRWALDSCRFL